MDKPCSNRPDLLTPREVAPPDEMDRAYVLPMVSQSAAAPKVRATLYVAPELLDEARNAVFFLAGYPLRLTLARFVEDAFRAELKRLKELHTGGEGFPPRSEELKGGRPIAA
jgi:hypothetical protein